MLAAISSRLEAVCSVRADRSLLPAAISLLTPATEVLAWRMPTTNSARRASRARSSSRLPACGAGTAEVRSPSAMRSVTSEAWARGRRMERDSSQAQARLSNRPTSEPSQQRDALGFAARSGLAGLCHALALELGQLVHRRCIGIGRRPQLVGDGVWRQSLACLAALHEVIPHRAKAIPGLVDGVKQRLRLSISRQLVQALAHFGRTGRRGFAVSIDACGVGGVVDLQQGFRAGGAKHHDGVQFTRQQCALGRRAAQVIRNVLQACQSPDAHRCRQGHDETDHPKSQGQTDCNTCVGNRHGGSREYEMKIAALPLRPLPELYRQKVTSP